MISIAAFAYLLSTCMCKYSKGRCRERLQPSWGLRFNVPRLPRAGPSDSKEKYTTVWTFRGIMLLRMEQVGMKSLPLGGITLDKFASMNPDQKGNLEKLIAGYWLPLEKLRAVSSVQQLLALCNNPRPELLSMICCFAGDKCFDLIDIDTIDVQAWARKRKQLERLHGMSQHVAQLCKKMRRG